MGRQGDQGVCEEGGGQDGRFGLYCFYKGYVLTFSLDLMLTFRTRDGNTFASWGFGRSNTVAVI
jgi:hypothetical protein